MNTKIEDQIERFIQDTLFVDEEKEDMWDKYRTQHPKTNIDRK